MEGVRSCSFISIRGKDILENTPSSSPPQQILFNLAFAMSNQLPGTTATNGRGDPERVSIFAMPGTEEEEVPLWQFFEEEAASNNNLRIPAVKYKRNTCRFCKKTFEERKRLNLHPALTELVLRRKHVEYLSKNVIIISIKAHL